MRYNPCTLLLVPSFQIPVTVPNPNHPTPHSRLQFLSPKPQIHWVVPPYLIPTAASVRRSDAEAAPTPRGRDP